jgi:hypothetical protein
LNHRNGFGVDRYIVVTDILVSTEKEVDEIDGSIPNKGIIVGHTKLCQWQ